jgi:cation diffusion facilitator CzcD-associated flavoprotein CzcO
LVEQNAKFCIVGAGSSGLAAAKNFRQAGIACDVVEREDDVGGNWYYGKPASSVYRSTHLISSKRLTEFTDFPMPADYPEFPSHEQAWEYLRSYARAFDLYPLIEFNRSVLRIEPAGERWRVTLDDGSLREYAGVVIANGHNWDARMPEYPGSFDGLVLHSSEYKAPDVLEGRRVLVVGAGNSGCDIAVESAQNAVATFHSVRRGYHYLPKFLLGKPIDLCGERLLKWRFPLWMRRFITRRMVQLALGSPQSYGLPAPDHKLFETHPIVNSQMLYYVGHGRIKVKPDVEELCGHSVRFVDGSQEPIDVLIYATGFRIRFPFIEEKYLNWRHGRPELFLHIFHPEYDNLFVAGLIQPDSGQWGLVDYQAQLIARYVQACRYAPARAERFRRLKRSSQPDLTAGIDYVRSTRHLLEVEHFSYARRLKKLIAALH